jgi:hypothetical protein
MVVRYGNFHGAKELGNILFFTTSGTRFGYGQSNLVTV